MKKTRTIKVFLPFFLTALVCSMTACNKEKENPCVWKCQGNDYSITLTKINDNTLKSNVINESQYLLFFQNGYTYHFMPCNEMASYDTSETCILFDMYWSIYGDTLKDGNSFFFVKEINDSTIQLTFCGAEPNSPDPFLNEYLFIKQ